ncbi:MAG: o-succinylbenzoate synthase [Anaerolineae bacterium]|nr:o-succinylbenzoate synthase [Anaerolineae bacterium]
MRIERIELHRIQLSLVTPFETSFGRMEGRQFILLSLHSGEFTGWGECTTQMGPWYSSETTETAWHVLSEFLVPQVLGEDIAEPSDIAGRFRRIRGHQMAKATLENAFWDVSAQSQGVPLAGLLGGTVDRVRVGVSIGIRPTLDDLLETVAQRVDEGYGRVKLKIRPGWDVDVVRAVRERWPALPLQVDGNCAYTPERTADLKELDEYELLLIEQPFHHDDLLDHSRLQSQIRTPICLDESIQSPEHARWALDIGACRIINIKVGRVGGLTAARQIHNMCAERGVPVWCGGMLETNVGRATNVAISSLPNFTLPSDISASVRYYQKDIAEPNFDLQDGSTLAVPLTPGLGVTVDTERLESLRDRYQVFEAE